MTPEELDDIKAFARLLPESLSRNKIFLLLAHIDSQEHQIENRNLMIGMLQEAISTQTSKIEVLKEKLVSMMTTTIWKASYDSVTGKYTISDIDADRMARQQLKAEMVGVEWE